MDGKPVSETIDRELGRNLRYKAWLDHLDAARGDVSRADALRIYHSLAMKSLDTWTESDQFVSRAISESPSQSEYSKLVAKALEDAASIQEFLWDDDSSLRYPFSPDDWRRVFQKRVDKIAQIDPENPSARVELRKRLLQQAALSLKAIINLKETYGE